VPDAGSPAAELARLIAPLREAPAKSAALFDVDGTLAPIVRDPADAAVPAPTREALRALARRFALVACVSGRRAAEARRLVGVGELAYAGNHGLEVLAPGDEQVALDPTLGARVDAARDFALALGPEALAGAGLRLEDKGPIQALHWRAAADQTAAEREARRVADRAKREGLEPRWGRKVLELRPIAGVDKGTAVRRLLDRHGLELALFAGDDRTDLDAFRALRELVGEGVLRAAVCVGIASDEGPPELSEEADAVIGGPGDLLETLTALGEGPGADDGPR
jgi:trehalose 6-phosphate phosphatase